MSKPTPQPNGEKRQTQRAEVVEWRPFPVDAIPQPVGRYIQAVVLPSGVTLPLWPCPYCPRLLAQWEPLRESS